MPLATLSNAMYWLALITVMSEHVAAQPVLVQTFALTAMAIALINITRGHWQLASTLVCALFLLIASIINNSLSNVWLTAFAVLGVMCIIFQQWSAIPRILPPTGSYKVGVRRMEFLLDDGEASQCYAFYPAAPSAGSIPRSYHTSQESKAFASVYDLLRVPGFIKNHFQLAQTHSYENAPIAPLSDDEALPLAVFVHGGGMHPLQNYTLLQELASRGYVVLAPSFPGISAGVAWNDGRITPMKAEALSAIQLPAEGTAVQAAYLLSQDARQRQSLLVELREHSARLQSLSSDITSSVSAVLTALLSGGADRDAKEILSLANVQRRVFIGMSIGGSVAHTCCHRDAFAVAGVNLDGMNWNFDLLHRNSPVPFLQLYADPLVSMQALKQRASVSVTTAPQALSKELRMTNDAFYTSDHEESWFDHNVYRLIWRGKQHMDFTDLALGTRYGPHVQDVVRLNLLCARFIDSVCNSSSSHSMDGLIARSNDLVKQRN